MFDQVYVACQRYSVAMSLWVDNLELSGPSVPGVLLGEIREIVRRNGLRTHDIRYKQASRPVTITGVVVDKGRVVAPRSVHERIRRGYATLRIATSEADRFFAINALLSSLGTYKYLMGRTSAEGRKTSDRMNALCQRQSALEPIFITLPDPSTCVAPPLPTELVNKPPF